MIPYRLISLQDLFGLREEPQLWRVFYLKTSNISKCSKNIMLSVSYFINLLKLFIINIDK